jgi:hypothetical protein
LQVSQPELEVLDFVLARLGGAKGDHALGVVHRDDLFCGPEVR